MWKAGLTNAPLDDADLGCIKDTKSKFESCVSLAFAELRGAWFTGAKLDKIDLTGAHIGCREVPDYDEVGVDTSCTNFQGAQFGGGARLDDLYSDSDEMLTRAWKKNLPVGWSFDGAKVRKSERP